MSSSPSIRRRLVRGTALGAVLTGTALATTGCSIEDFPNFMSIPDPITEQGRLTFTLWQGSWITAMLTGLVVWGLILFSCFAHRRRRGETGLPPQVRYNLPIEILYTVIPTIMVGALFFFTARDQAQILSLSANPDKTVDVIGQRWSWTFNYADDDAYDVGTPAVVPVLYVPVDQTVRFNLRSADVIHSFWIPATLMKMDVVPGRQNSFEVKFTETGTFAGKCAELCGAYHARMLFNVEVVDQEEYDAHIADLQARGQTGELVSSTVSTDAGTSVNTGDDARQNNEGDTGSEQGDPQ